MRWEPRYRRAAFAMLAAMLLADGAPARADVALDRMTVTLQSRLERVRVARQFAGATAAVVLPDGREIAVASGLADVERGAGMRPDSRMPIGSIGKTFVAALTIALAQEGRLSLDDPVSKWLGDESWYPRLQNSTAITVRHLLNHGSGVADHVRSPGFAQLLRERSAGDWRNQLPHRDLVALILDRPPAFPAGQGYAYTDTNYIVLGLVLEKAGGFDLDEEVVRRYLYPFDLSQTAPQDGLFHPGIAQGYVRRELAPGMPQTAIDAGIFRWNFVTEWTGGGFVGSSRDLARWARALYGGRAIGARGIETMIGGINPHSAREGYDYGLGVAVQTVDAIRVWRHGGVFLGYVSSMNYYPDFGLAVAIQMNADGVPSATIRDMAAEVAEVVLKACRARAPLCRPVR